MKYVIIQTTNNMIDHQLIFDIYATIEYLIGG